MDLLPSKRPRDDLHRSRVVAAPCADPDLKHAAARGRKQGSMPGEQSLGVEGLLVVARGVQHHFNDALDVAVGWLKASNVHAEPARDGGADLFRIQLFALD